MNYGIFSTEDVGYYGEEEAVEAGFGSLEEAQEAIATRYNSDDDLEAHVCESLDDPVDEDDGSEEGEWADD